MSGEALRRGRVLVVDDEQAIVEILCRILRREHDVIACTDPMVALTRLMGGESYDAILCDMMMPKLTGMDLHAALLHYRPEQAQRMVFVSGGATRDAHEVFLGSTTMPCIRKPFVAPAVLAVVRKVVGT